MDIFIVLILGLPVYFMPSIIAFANKKTNTVSIFALNFFLGWTLFGWVASLVWALAKDK